jgi:hypothetical protein
MLSLPPAPTHERGSAHEKRVRRGVRGAGSALREARGAGPEYPRGDMREGRRDNFYFFYFA